MVGRIGREGAKIRLMKDTSKATKGELQAIDKGSNILLLRYDKQWYEEVSPKRKKMKRRL